MMAIRQLKYIQARLLLMRFIAQGGYSVGDRLPSEREMLQYLPCSAVTMRHALADMESSGLIQRRNGSGTYLRQEIGISPFSNTVLYVSIHLKNKPTMGSGLDPLRRLLAQHGVDLSYVSTDSFNDSVIHAAEKAIGILVDGYANDDVLHGLQTLSLPMIVLGNTTYSLPVPNVKLDLITASYRLTEHMVSQGLRKIALFRGEDSYISGLCAEQGYLQGLKMARVPPLIMKVNHCFDYDRAIEEFMARHSDVQGILMEHTTFLDFCSWCWRHDYPQHPHIGFLSHEPGMKQYRQSDNFLWLDFDREAVVAGKMLMDHIIDGKPMQSIKIKPVIHMIDTPNETFVH